MSNHPTWGDAWLLFSLVKADGDVAQANKVADAVNKAVPTLEEWEHARLVFGQLSLIDPTSEGWILTDLAYRTVGSDGLNSGDSIDRLHWRLDHLADEAEGR